MKKRKTTKLIALFAALVMTVTCLPLGAMTSAATVIPASGWSTGGDTLYINNAADLWAFAEALNKGTTFSGKTIKLTTDITVNEGVTKEQMATSTPSDTWPLTNTNQKFAGTFDGQGHTISGLCLKTSGQNVGFFGNVARGTTATVKDLTLTNACIVNTSGAHTGGIFGLVETESDTVIADDNHVNTTKAIIDHVNLDVLITAGGNHSGDNGGVAGFVGQNCADVTITNSTVGGKVTSASRGVAAFVGATYPKQETGEINTYITHTVIKDCVNTMTLDVSASGATRFAGALVGYANSNTDHFEVRRVLSLSKVLIAQAEDNPVGYLFGGTWCSANSKRNGTTVDYQTWTLEDVVYESVFASTMKDFGKTTGGQKFIYDGAVRGIASSDLSDYFRSTAQQSLTLRNDLTYNLFIRLADPNATVTVNGAVIEPSSKAGLEYRYSLSGILPQQLRDPLTFAITQHLSDGREIVTHLTTSVYSYLLKLWNAEQTTQKEKDLIADLLRYGAQAQINKDHNTQNLATDGIDLSGYGSTVDPSAITAKYAKSGTAHAEYAIENISLSLDNSVALLCSFRAASTEGLSVQVSLNGRTHTFTTFSYDAQVGNFVTFDGISAHEMNAAITVTLLKNGVQIGQSVTVSVADYVKMLLNSEKAEHVALKPLASALYAYGQSAQSYDDANRLVLSSDYVIVCDNDASDAVKDAAARFASALADKTGLSLRVVNDTQATQDKEILIGNMDGRVESTAAQSHMTVKDGYRVTVIGQKLVICGSDEMIDYAQGRLLEELRLHGGSNWSVPNTYVDTVDLPGFAAFASATQASYYAGSQNHTKSFTSATANQYNAFVAALTAAGFEAYTTNTIGENLFGTYIKTTGGYHTAVYTMYYPSAGNVRVTYGPVDFLPDLEADPADTSDCVTPSIILNARRTAQCLAPGMSIVLQLADGSFIIIDGGNPDQELGSLYYDPNGGEKVDEKFKYNDDKEMTQDAKLLYDLLVSMTPAGEKPTIAAWMITHAHGDHISLANQFLKTYHAYVDVKMAAYNFPDFATVTIKNENPLYMQVLADAFIQEMNAYYPDASHWVFHTGERLNLPGCEIEIFYTPEDYYGTYAEATFPWGNQTSSAFRITLNGTSLMVLGDCEADICEQMANRYKDALESDVLQTSHHGYNGANAPFYQYIDPKICLWPTNQLRFDNDERCIGSSTASSTSQSSFMYANWWLRNTEWTRADGTHGSRTHYVTQTDKDWKILCPYDGKITIVTPWLKF